MRFFVLPILIAACVAVDALPPDPCLELLAIDHPTGRAVLLATGDGRLEVVSVGGVLDGDEESSSCCSRMRLQALGRDLVAISMICDGREVEGWLGLRSETSRFFELSARAPEGSARERQVSSRASDLSGPDRLRSDRVAPPVADRRDRPE